MGCSFLDVFSLTYLEWLYLEHLFTSNSKLASRWVVWGRCSHCYFPSILDKGRFGGQLDGSRTMLWKGLGSDSRHIWAFISVLVLRIMTLGELLNSFSLGFPFCDNDACFAKPTPNNLLKCLVESRYSMNGIFYSTVFISLIKINFVPFWGFLC